jgi:hypothetical protein
MRNRTGGLFEVIWFVLGGLLLFMGIDVSTEAGITGSWYYFVFSLLAFVMYLRRRSIRIKSK